MKQPRSPHFMIVYITIKLSECNDCYLEAIVPTNWYELPLEKKLQYLKKLERRNFDFTQVNYF